jgi:hypothetical protein
MRKATATVELPARERAQRPRVTSRASSDATQAWRKRAVRDAIAVRRAVCGAKGEAHGAVGLEATVEALRHGSVGELLVTRRFAERYPIAAANTAFLAAIAGAESRTVTGPAELELDLAAGGVAALLRPAVDGV